MLIINNNYTYVKTTKIILHLIEEDYNTNNTPHHILFAHQAHLVSGMLLVIFISCLRYRRVTEPHSRLPGWSPVHLYGGRARGRRSSDRDSVYFEALGRAGHTAEITLITINIMTHDNVYIICTYAGFVSHICRHTCKPLDSASFSAEPPQGLEQDRQTDRPLANTGILWVSQTVLCGV